MALLTKTVTATLPAALLVVFWWQRGRLGWRRDVAPLIPWFVLAAAGGLLTSWVERTLHRGQGAEFDLTLLQRCLLAGRVVWFYLGKLPGRQTSSSSILAGMRRRMPLAGPDTSRRPFW